MLVTVPRPTQLHQGVETMASRVISLDEFKFWQRSIVTKKEFTYFMRLVSYTEVSFLISS